jgi:hypothetical protein
MRIGPYHHKISYVWRMASEDSFIFFEELILMLLNDLIVLLKGFFVAVLF